MQLERNDDRFNELLSMPERQLVILIGEKRSAKVLGLSPSPLIIESITRKWLNEYAKELQDSIASQVNKCDEEDIRREQAPGVAFILAKNLQKCYENIPCLEIVVFLLRSEKHREYFLNEFDTVILKGDSVVGINSEGGQPPASKDLGRDGDSQSLTLRASFSEEAPPNDTEIAYARLVLAWAANAGLIEPMGSQQGSRSDLKGDERRAHEEIVNLKARVPSSEASEITPFLKRHRLTNLDLVRAGHQTLKILFGPK